jgi:hypothetical protein
MTTLIISVISLVVFIALTISAYKFGKVIGHGIGRATLKREINNLTVRDLLHHKKNKLENL